MNLKPDIIRDTFEAAKPIADEVATKFYEILWSDYPSSKELFKEEKMDKQKKSLVHALVQIVDHLEDPDFLLPYLKKMGARHCNYDVKEEQYAWVAASFIKTLQHFFDENWNNEFEEQWNIALNFVAETMIAGMREHTQSKNTQATDKGGKLRAETTQEETFTITLPAHVREQIRVSVKVAVSEAIQNEIDRAIAEELGKLNNQELQNLIHFKKAV